MTLRPRCPLVLAVALSLTPLAAAETAPGDQASGRLTGALSDRTGAAIATGTITLRGGGGAAARSTRTQADGRYAFEGLVAGTYIVSAQAPGFARSSARRIDLTAGAPTSADFTLDVEPRTDYVLVTAPVGARPLEIVTDARQARQPVPAHDGADYLKSIPGFSVIRKGGTDGDLLLRGMAGSRLGVLLEGENVLGGCGQRMDPPTAYAFPEAYDRITVLKGPQTVAHGPGQSAGVVLFEKERLRFERPGVEAYLSPTVGSFGRNDQVADVRAGRPAGYVRASVTRSASDDYTDGAGRVVHSRYERWSAQSALGWTPDDDTTLELSGARSDGEAAYADRIMDGVRFARENLGLRLERRRPGRRLAAFDAQVAYNYVDHVMDNFSLRTFTPSMMMPAASVSNPDRRTLSARLAATFQLGSVLAVLGGDWQDNRHTVRGSSNQAHDPYAAQARVQDATFTNTGVFAEVSRALGARGRLATGARLDLWEGRDDRQAVALGMSAALPNPTASTTRRETLPSGFVRYERELGAGTTLYAGLGQARRAPDYWELVSKESAGSASAFGTRPERTTQLDVGLLRRAGRLSGSLPLFANEVSDFILIQSQYPKAVAGMGLALPTRRLTTIARNIDASSWGGEASLACEATARLQVDASLAYVSGRNRTDDLPLAQIPPLETRLGARYSGGRWSLGALARVVAAQTRYALNQGNIVGQDLGPTAGFRVVSLNGSLRLARRLNLTAGVDNLFDTEYAEFVSRGGAVVEGFPATLRVNEPGRTAWLKLDLRC
jgi:iron complex outermembrane receptor protein